MTAGQLSKSVCIYKVVYWCVCLSITTPFKDVSQIYI